MNLTGAVLQAILKRQGMTQTELAAALGVTAGTITHIVSGRRQTMDQTLSERLSSVLGTAPAFWHDLHNEESTGAAKSVSHYLELAIPLQDGKPPAGVLVDHQIKLLVRQDRESLKESEPDAILLEGFENDRLRASSYDTRIGGYWEERAGVSRPKDVNGEVKIPGRSRMKVYTHEYFGMPASIHGRIAPAGSFLKCGVVVAHGPLIDPHFEGRLTVTLHNFYEDPLLIPTSEAFLTIVFERLSSVPARPRKLVASLAGEADLEGDFTEREEALLRELQQIRASRRK